ncbi:hypothetical protein EDD16DRAFT_1520798 [Pisolithus croceorrhizus]|nr:hypothetical protein EV401DRAFT_1894936 [Pisolithus croceorrhizus]KAI6115075.1 hypothetical protein EDD16DRAFT_1520798 [Pisolithus croceorrhizus]
MSTVESSGCLMQSHPLISLSRLKKIKANTMSPTKVQPGRNAKSCHQMIKGLTVEECEQQYLNPFCTKMVTLNNGQQLHPQVALQQLHAGLISKDEIVEDGDCDEGENTHDELAPLQVASSCSSHPPMDESTSPNADMDSKTEE